MLDGVCVSASINKVINLGKPERKGNMEFVIAVLIVAVLVYVILYVV